MIKHSGFRLALARMIAQDAQILALARQAFGRGVAVYCDRWAAAGLPGEEDCPACFVFSDGSGDSGQSDESTFQAVVRFAVASREDMPINRTEAQRTADANGLMVCEGSRVAEAMRDRAVEILRESAWGAFVFQVERYENSFAGWPLAWSDAAITMFEPEVVPPVPDMEQQGTEG